MNGPDKPAMLSQKSDGGFRYAAAAIDLASLHL
jgi:hypothetical protein